LSRIGKRAVTIPSGVQATMSGSTLTVKGPKGSASRSLPTWLSVEIDGKGIHCKPAAEVPEAKAQWGLHRVLISNMVEGVAAGYRKDLEIVGVGYKAEMKGKDLALSVGLSHPVQIPSPAGIKIAAGEQNKVYRISVEGVDKELVGQVAANIRRVRPPEPYQGKGIRYVGEHVIRKVGKAAGK
jgi:large subunit ribosomal protein L6